MGTETGRFDKLSVHVWTSSFHCSCHVDNSLLLVNTKLTFGSHFLWTTTLNGVP